jgi:hypothetical protein
MIDRARIFDSELSSHAALYAELLSKSILRY